MLMPRALKRLLPEWEVSVTGVFYRSILAYCAVPVGLGFVFSRPHRSNHPNPRNTGAGRGAGETVGYLLPSRRAGL
jgi:hypothetical protein